MAFSSTAAGIIKAAGVCAQEKKTGIHVGNKVLFQNVLVHTPPHMHVQETERKPI